jgi:aspartyl-tRNA(Asn)/glutamyl-tRNA(Gln) amidotransferase subunit C
MSKLEIKDVEHIAKLSRLELTSAEKEKFAEQLSDILSYVDLLNEVDTANIEPTAQVTGLENVMVEDKIEESGVTYQDIEKNAPEVEGGAYKVPGVFN